MVDGVPLQGNYHMKAALPAACSRGGFPGGTQTSASPWRHHLWVCPVVQAVGNHLVLAVRGSVSRNEAWLMQDSENLQQCVGNLVVLPAVSAMESGKAIFTFHGTW